MKEKLKREAERTLAALDLLHFTKITFPAYQAAEHHQRIARALEAVARGAVSRLIVTMPPRHGKSELTSVRFPAWYLGNSPDKRVILASYSDSLAQFFSRQVRNLILDEAFREVFPDVYLAPGSSAADDWSLLAHRGGLRAAGVGSGITGRGADLLIIDDPVKDAAEADSPTYRNRTWEWYTRAAYTRLQSGAAVVVIGTRWHQDDLIGRLLEYEGDWTVLHLPAIDRAGKALWPERYGLSALGNIRETLGDRAWSALYQGNPVVESGGIFERSDFKVVDAIPAGGTACRFWDFAATEAKMRGDPDYTVGLRMVRVGDRFFITDLVRGQMNPAQTDERLVNAARQDGVETAVRWELESGASGKRDSYSLATKLLGYDAMGIRPQGDKVLRAKPFAAQVKAGNVALVAGAWNRAYLDELAAFPYGAHDDQVDASSGAFTELVGGTGVVERLDSELTGLLAEFRGA